LDSRESEPFGFASKSSLSAWVELRIELVLASSKPLTSRIFILSSMVMFVNPLENLAVVRLLEFLSDRSPWNRSLWGIGVVLALDELYEACSVMAQGHLSEASVRRVTSSLNKRVGLHPGFTGAEKRLLNQHLQQVPRPNSVGHYTIRQISSIVSVNYLTRWAKVVASGN
jgi:hypothetical protein